VDLSEIESIDLVTVLGQVVRTLEVSELQSVDMRDVEPGVYLVNIHSTKGSIALRIVKQ
jgi:hypothetical protein